jgi:hypothetical protein
MHFVESKRVQNKYKFKYVLHLHNTFATKFYILLNHV